MRPFFLHRFLVGSSDSDSEDDKRVVRSAKDRRYDELRGTCDEIRVGFCPAPVLVVKQPMPQFSCTWVCATCLYMDM